jgi:hypothetical protein
VKSKPVTDAVAVAPTPLMTALDEMINRVTDGDCIETLEFERF